jgi:PPP family 3-phenylpropionic acid transporter
VRRGRAAIAASYFFYFGAIGVFQPYWPSYLASLGYGAGAIGVLLAVFNGLRLAAPYLCARAADHARDRRTVLWVLGALATGAALALTQLHGMLALAVGLAGFSVAIHGLMPIVDSLSIERPRGSLRYGWLRLWGSLGFLACSALLGALLAHHDPALIPWALAALVGATALTLGALPRAAATPAAGADADAGDRRALARLLLIAFLHLTGFGAYYGFYTLYLSHEGYAPATIGLYWSFGVVAEIGLFLAAPALLSRIAPVRLLQVALGGSVLRWALCALLPGSRPVMLAAQALHGLGFALFHVVGVRLAPRLVPVSHAVRAQALVSAVGWGAGGIAGSLLAGTLWETFGPAASFWAATALALGAFGLSYGLKVGAGAGGVGPGMDRIAG